MNTTAVKLKWHNQNASYTYLVIARQNTMVVQNDSTVEETYTFFHLTPGALYTFDVFTVVEGVKSAVNTISSYTSKLYSMLLLAKNKKTNSQSKL